MPRFILLSMCLLAAITAKAQQTNLLADSIREIYNIPALAYAVVSSDSVFVISVTGVQHTGTAYQVNVNSRFRIGSNTKAITGFIAAQLVQQGKLKWNTKFFDLFPELKAGSNPAYHQLTLLNLLTFRTRLYPYTYTYATPSPSQFTGTDSAQRYQFTQWFLQQPPVSGKGKLHFSNLGYVAAGLMLEKATGKSYTTLVQELGLTLGIQFGFGAPNTADTLQPWGHTNGLAAEPPAPNPKLNWLMAAGNVNVSLPGYIKFIQLQLRGLNNTDTLLPAKIYHKLHYGKPRFAVGWFWAKQKGGRLYSYNTGNPGSFLSKVYVMPYSNKAYILFANVQTALAEEGLDNLYEKLKLLYGNR